MLEMKKQISAYRKEIIELSTSNKRAPAAPKLEPGLVVPRLDLSKVRHDSDSSEESGKDGTY